MEGSPSGQTSSSLLHRARGQDAAAWETICQLYTPLIYRWCARLSVSPDERADVAQDVLLAVYRKLGDFRRDQPNQSFRSWLKTITRHKSIDRTRYRDRIGLVPQDVDVSEMADPVSDEELSDGDASETSLLLRNAFSLVQSDFPSWYATAFDLIVLKERPTEEVSERLGKSAGAIWNAKSRMLKELRERFAELI